MAGAPGALIGFKRDDDLSLVADAELTIVYWLRTPTEGPTVSRPSEPPQFQQPANAPRVGLSYYGGPPVWSSVAAAGERLKDESATSARPLGTR